MSIQVLIKLCSQPSGKAFGLSLSLSFSTHAATITNRKSGGNTRNRPEDLNARPYRRQSIDSSQSEINSDFCGWTIPNNYAKVNRILEVCTSLNRR